MQIIKGDRNSQLKKDEETHLRRMNPQRSMAQMLKTSLKSRAPLRWGIVVGNALVGRHHGCSGEVPCNIQSKEETGEKEEDKEDTVAHGDTVPLEPALRQSTIHSLIIIILKLLYEKLSACNKFFSSSIFPNSTLFQ